MKNNKYCADLVKNKPADFLQWEGLSQTNVVDQPAGRRDQDVDPFPESSFLRFLLLAAAQNSGNDPESNFWKILIQAIVTQL